MNGEALLRLLKHTYTTVTMPNKKMTVPPTTAPMRIKVSTRDVGGEVGVALAAIEYRSTIVNEVSELIEGTCRPHAPVETHIAAKKGARAAASTPSFPFVAKYSVRMRLSASFIDEMSCVVADERSMTPSVMRDVGAVSDAGDCRER